MAILNIQTEFTGEVGVIPRIIHIGTNNTQDEVLEDNFLSATVGYTFYPTDLAVVSLSDNTSSLYRISVTPGSIQLVPSVTQIAGTHETTWEGAIPATQGNIIYIKTGNLVTLLFPNVLADGNDTQNNISATTALPVSLRPIITFQEVKIVQTNGDINRDAGMVQIATNGNIDWGKDTDFTAFDAVTTEIGFSAMTVTYPVA
jgi:hypothetical protein